MHNLIMAIPTGIAAFIATNLDDIFILLLFFSRVNTLLRRRHIVMGQYLGFTILVLMSLSGFLGGIFFPPSWIGILGLTPIILGVRQWLETDEEESDETPNIEQNSAFSPLTNYLSPQACGVAAVTFANGGDNIGIYVPLFANCTWGSLVVILSIFFTLVGVWCYIAYRLSHIPIVAESLTRYGSYFIPFVLIALGVSILSENHTLEDPILRLIILVISIVSYMMFHKTEQATQPSQD
ncbi:cadmium resistance transporter [Chroococcus sp. FPU101]|uniref:cadmium resistance transporter n=1 Tax=Chroococcus sp. FPU101 TaxID=1974212 RepID=UPI001A8D8E76|nr:cadmium resistance transporter [Chroococcus sp. FPU101]GFE69154.1 cadmium resistance transporter [Chroococcus sp. FPU101]